MADCLYECLKEARLEKYYRNFVNGGLQHCEALLQLSMQEYPRYGVVLMEDRLRLFKLIQIVKSVQSEGLVCQHGRSKQGSVPLQQNQQHRVEQVPQQQQLQFQQYGNQMVNRNTKPRMGVAPPVAPIDYSNTNKTHTLFAPQLHHQSNNHNEGPAAVGAKNIPHAPQHISRKSFTQVTYKPHSDSPIFHCRKTLKFTDSDLDSDSSADEALVAGNKQSIDNFAGSSGSESVNIEERLNTNEVKNNSSQPNFQHNSSEISSNGAQSNMHKSLTNHIGSSSLVQNSSSVGTSNTASSISHVVNSHKMKDTHVVASSIFHPKVLSYQPGEKKSHYGNNTENKQYEEQINGNHNQNNQPQQQQQQYIIDNAPKINNNGNSGSTLSGDNQAVIGSHSYNNNIDVSPEILIGRTDKSTGNAALVPTLSCGVNPNRHANGIINDKDIMQEQYQALSNINNNINIETGATMAISSAYTSVSTSSNHFTDKQGGKKGEQNSPVKAITEPAVSVCVGKDFEKSRNSDCVQLYRDSGKNTNGIDNNKGIQILNYVNNSGVVVKSNNNNNVVVTEVVKKPASSTARSSLNNQKQTTSSKQYVVEEKASTSNHSKDSISGVVAVGNIPACPLQQQQQQQQKRHSGPYPVNVLVAGRSSQVIDDKQQHHSHNPVTSSTLSSSSSPSLASVSHQSQQPQAQLLGVTQGGHILYNKPLAYTIPTQDSNYQQQNGTSNQQIPQFEQHNLNSNQLPQQIRPFQFKNFQPLSVISGGSSGIIGQQQQQQQQQQQSTYFPPPATSVSLHHNSHQPQASLSSLNNNMASNTNHMGYGHVEKVYYQNAGYNYGVPGSSSHSATKITSSYNNNINGMSENNTIKGNNIETVKPIAKNSTNSDHIASNTVGNSAKISNFGNNKIRVCVRKRPMLNKEAKRGETDVIKMEGDDTVIVEESKVAVNLAKFAQQHIFAYDEVFGASCNNENVYSRTVKPLVQCVFNRGAATCFAFGQTGSGKSYTLLGNDNVPGLYQLAAVDIFSCIERFKSNSRGQLHLWASYYEIYCSNLFDLLNKRKRLHVRENNRHKVCIAGLMETEVHNVKGLVEVVQYGNAVRMTGASGANSQSSRSHAVLQLEVRDQKDVKMGRMSFIDLAGSERATDMTDSSDRKTRIEGAEINQSLLALKECIRSLDQDNKHTPYRQSKLTHILRDSFTGSSQTVMIANISPCMSACVHTLNTLKYADRVKELKKNQDQVTKSGNRTGKPVTPKLQTIRNGSNNKPPVIQPVLKLKTPPTTSSHSNGQPLSRNSNSQQSRIANERNAVRSSEKKNVSSQIMTGVEQQHMPLDSKERLNNESPSKGTPALFFDLHNNDMQFASTPKAKGSPVTRDTSSPFDVSRILREENDTPIRGHKIARNETQQQENISPEEQLLAPTKLNFDFDSDDENCNKQQKGKNALETNKNEGIAIMHEIHSPITLDGDNGSLKVGKERNGSVEDVISPVHSDVKRSTGDENYLNDYNSSGNGSSMKKIYIGADNMEKVNALIRKQRDRWSSDDLGGSQTGNNDVIIHSNQRVESPPILNERQRSKSSSNRKSDDHEHRPESPHYNSKHRSKSSGRTEERSSLVNKESYLTNQQSSESISDTRGRQVSRGRITDSYTDNKREDFTIDSLETNSRRLSSECHSTRTSRSDSRSKSNDRFSTSSQYPIKSHDEIMAEHKEVLDHLDSLLDRAKAAISESPSSTTARSDKSGEYNDRDSQEMIKAHNTNRTNIPYNNNETEKPLISILKKTPQSAGKVPYNSREGGSVNDMEFQITEADLQRNKIRHSDPLDSMYSREGYYRHDTEHFKSSDIVSVNQVKHNQNVLEKQEKELSSQKSKRSEYQGHGIVSEMHNAHYNEEHGEIVLQYEEGEPMRADSPCIVFSNSKNNNSSCNTSKHKFGPKISTERPRPDGELHRSNSRTSDKESERSVSRNMSWHDILSQSNSSKTSRDVSRDASLEEDKTGYASSNSKARIQDIDTVVIETNIITQSETGRSTGDSGISTHRSHDLDNMDIHGYSRGRNSDAHSSAETVDEGLGLYSGSGILHSDGTSSNNYYSITDPQQNPKISSNNIAPTSKLSVIHDSGLSIVPPLKLNLDDSTEDDEHFICDSNGKVIPGYTFDKAHSARELESYSSKLQSNNYNNGTKSARDLSLPQHSSSSAFTVVTETHRHDSQRKVSTGSNCSTGGAQPVLLTSKEIIQFSNPVTSEAHIVGLDFLPIESFPLTPRSSQVIAVPSINTQGTSNQEENKPTTPLSAGRLVDYLRSEKTKSVPRTSPNYPADSETGLSALNTEIFMGSRDTGFEQSHNIDQVKHIQHKQQIATASFSHQNNPHRNLTAVNGRDNTHQAFNGVEKARAFPNGAHGSGAVSSCGSSSSCSTATTVVTQHLAAAHGDGVGSRDGKTTVLPTGSLISQQQKQMESANVHQKQNTSADGLQDAQEMLMMCHEEQLSKMTSLCKQEMKLLMAVRMTQKGFPEYVRALEEILSDKGRAILLLKSKIDEYVKISDQH